MTLYQYDALSELGKKIGGTIDAENLADAKSKLLKQAIFLTRIEALSARKSKFSLTSTDVLNFTRELARLLNAGIPLYESLSALEEKYRGQPAQQLLLELCEQVRSGHSFSTALSKHGNTFNLLYVAMIENAQRTGRLNEALEELSALLTKQQQIRKQLISALLYPTLLFSFCLFVLGALLFYVVPSLQELFEGRELHPFTKIVFGLSRFACNSKLLLLGVAATIGISLSGFWILPKWKQFAFRQTLKIPILNRLLAKVALIRFFRAASTLLNGSVPIVSSFAQARTTMGHPILEKTIEQAELLIAQGEPIHVPFTRHPLIPPLVPRMLAIAEKGGNLDGMMRQIAEIYEEDLERTLTNFSTIAQPILLLFLGVIVGFVLLSVLIPLTDVSTFASK